MLYIGRDILRITLLQKQDFSSDKKRRNRNDKQEPKYKKLKDSPKGMPMAKRQDQRQKVKG